MARDVAIDLAYARRIFDLTLEVAGDLEGLDAFEINVRERISALPACVRRDLGACCIRQACRVRRNLRWLGIQLNPCDKRCPKVRFRLSGLKSESIRDAHIRLFPQLASRR